MNDMRVTELLGQMRALALQAQGKTVTAEPHARGADFTALLKSSIDSVNNAQQQASRLAQAFELGDPKVDLAQVMVASQKAGVAFQAMTQVRNKLVSAYEEIMRMQV